MKSKENYNTLENLNLQYKRGKDYLTSIDLINKTRRANELFDGEHWKGAGDNDTKLNPMYNIIKKIVKYSTANICINEPKINYSDMSAGGEPDMEQIISALNSYATQTFERIKLAALRWEMWQQSFICGDSYLFFYNKNLSCQVLYNTDVILSDETQADIQKQKYIMLSENIYVSEARAEARRNGTPSEQIENISEDYDSEVQTEKNASYIGDENKTTRRITKLYKKDSMVYITRFTKDCILQDETAINLSLYPIVALVCERKYKSARGAGIVFEIMNNQYEINKILTKRGGSIETTAYPTRVVNDALVTDGSTEQLKRKNPIIHVNAEAQDIRSLKEQAFSVLEPYSISSDAEKYQKELADMSRELSGSGDTLANVNPENASGSAILAAKASAEMPSNSQKATDRQFMEDIALVWLDMWRGINRGQDLNITARNDGGVQKYSILGGTLEQLDFSVRIDITHNEPFSVLAQEKALEWALSSAYIKFEEYVEALPSGASAPKAKYEEILRKRQEQMMAEMQAQAAAMNFAAANPEGEPPVVGVSSERALPDQRVIN